MAEFPVSCQAAGGHWLPSGDRCLACGAVVNKEAYIAMGASEDMAEALAQSDLNIAGLWRAYMRIVMEAQAKRISDAFTAGDQLVDAICDKGREAQS